MAQGGTKSKRGAEHGHCIMCALDAFRSDDVVSIRVNMDRRFAPLFVPVLDVKHRKIADETPAHGGLNQLKARYVSRTRVVLDPVEARSRVLLVNTARREHRAVICGNRQTRLGQRLRFRDPSEQASGVIPAKLRKHLVVSASR
jgi:hypothetical protein